MLEKFTRHNKLWVALIMAALMFIKNYTQIDLGVDPETASNILSVITAVLVWFVPNSKNPVGGSEVIAVAAEKATEEKK